jgi:hypothetical protein
MVCACHGANRAFGAEPIHQGTGDGGIAMRSLLKLLNRAGRQVTTQAVPDELLEFRIG